ncbi:hypothetical protein RRG08_049765 [Elysia crispata]|uniref:EF-hand domain-containing protein n=1 Tax=Elysia crispata TaxID=231223 RepID=A0AAE1D4I6_9GAST|nr:hypothetical protein RRG08_049765 [Elysia crispata]
MGSHHVHFCLVFTYVTHSWGQESDMYGIINTLYYRADHNKDGLITEPELYNIYQGFDKNGDKQVSQDEFRDMWIEFFGQKAEMALAYFFLSDLNNDGVITDSDVLPVYLRFDLNNDGQVEAQEFNLKWQEIYRESPLAVLFLRADASNDHRLQRDEYPRLFSSLGNNADGSVTVSEFASSWVSEHFGTDKDGQALASALDVDFDWVVTTRETETLLSRYDSNDNGEMEIIEVVQMVKLLPPH